MFALAAFCQEVIGLQDVLALVHAAVAATPHEPKPAGLAEGKVDLGVDSKDFYAPESTPKSSGTGPMSKFSTGWSVTS